MAYGILKNDVPDDSTTDNVNATWITEEPPIATNLEITDTNYKVLSIVPAYCNGSYFESKV